MFKMLCGLTLAAMTLSYPVLAASMESPLVGVWRVVRGQAPDPTTLEEAPKLYTTLSAFDGSYEVADDRKFVVHDKDPWKQAWTGTDPSSEVTINGDTLTVSFTTMNPRTGGSLAVTTISQRVE
jgi:hypothetical protein